jgi:2-keto-4-pentenoate hydratase
MGKEYRPFGFLPESRILSSGVSFSLSTFANLAIEPELCLVLSSPLRGNVGPAAARAAVGEIRPAFELNEKRTVNDPDQTTILADGCGAWGIVTGEGAAVRDGLVDTTVQLFQNGELVEESTPGETMDDPFLSLARLSAKLDQHGRGLECGQKVITGSFSRALIDGPGQWTAVFGDIGTVTVTLT